MRTYGNTDKGVTRPTNQDGYIIEVFQSLNAVLLVVCDGMGGANAGNVASRYAIERFVQSMHEQLEPDMDDVQTEDALRISAQKANQAVFELSVKQPEFRGMGTTLVASLARGRKITLINIGDSRAYRVNGREIEQLTLDHSYVQEMVRAGKLTEEQARNHPHKNIITRAVGVDVFTDSDIFHYELSNSDILLLCSDGLTGMVEDEQIAQIISESDSLEKATDNLIAKACENGGTDNITVALYSYDDAEQ